MYWFTGIDNIELLLEYARFCFQMYIYMIRSTTNMRERVNF